MQSGKGAGLRWTAVFLFSLFAVFFILIAAGLFDPEPVGVLQWQRPLAPQTIPAEAETLIWLDAPIPDGDYSARLTAVHQSGEPDSAYGLLLGDEANNLIIAVAPTGYASVWGTKSGDDSASFLAPFAIFPHVGMENRENEIWLDLRGNAATIRINRELFWEGEIERPSAQIGLWGKSWGETAVIDFQSIRVMSNE